MAALKLLVAEDDALKLQLMRNVLEDLNAIVLPVSNSQEGSTLIRREKFDAIIINFRMATAEGFELARLARESAINKDTPVVIIASGNERDALHLSFSVGASYVLQEPVDRQTLASVLRGVGKPLTEDNRRFRRVPLTTSVTCTVGDDRLYGLTWNISQGGMQVEVVGLKMGDLVSISFLLLESTTPIRAEGRVVWVSEDRQGLYFTVLSVEHQKTIRNFISCG